MKLSFSTRGWHNNSFEEFCDIAVDLGFEGIELHNIHNRLFTEKDGAFHDYAAAATLRRLYEKNLSIPCIDAVCNTADEQKADEAFQEIAKCAEIAKNLKIPNIRLKAVGDPANEQGFETTARLIERVLPVAKQNGVTLLLETSGVFGNTAALRDMLNRFARR